MNPRLDRWGDPIEDDDTLARTGDEIAAHIAELRRILREAKARRPKENHR